MMKAVALIALVSMAGCTSTEPPRSAAPAPSSPTETSPPQATNAAAPDQLSTTKVGGRSKATYMRLENRVGDWWGGNGVPITWKVTEVDSFDWDGTSRPDNPPPQGLHGLVQQAFSGERKTRLEINNPGGNSDKTNRFVLTPIASIDGEDVPLAPIRVQRIGGSDEAWRLRSGDKYCSDAWETTTVPLTVKTPRGQLRYDLVLDCEVDSSGGSKVQVRNYQKD